MIAEILRRDIDTYADDLRKSPLLIAARNGSVTPKMVGSYLASVQVLLEHTPVHLRYARERADQLGLSRLVAFFDEKMQEEQDHDRWAAGDQERLAESFGTLARQKPLPSIRRVLENTERAIERSPYEYLAYILFAEYLTVVLGPEWVQALVDCGVPREALSAITQHAELDKDHVVDDCHVIDSLIEDVSLLDSLRGTLRTTMARFSDFFDAVHACAA
jgi:hypothetical protein